MPHTQHSFEDVLLMREARKAGLPFHSGMVVYIKASRDLNNMGFRAMKKWLRRFIAMDRDQDGFVEMKDFAKFLQMPAEDVSVQTVFRDAELEAGEERLSFRGYLYGVVGKARPLLQDASFVQSLFSVSYKLIGTVQVYVPLVPCTRVLTRVKVDHRQLKLIALKTGCTTLTSTVQSY